MRRRIVIIPVLAWAAGCSPSPVDSPASTHAEYWREYVTLQCETATSCDCEVQYASQEECFDSVFASTIARRGYYADLHFDPDCADRWLNLNRDLGCLFYRPNYPACKISYGDMAPGETCDIVNECTLGYRCLRGVCTEWHGGRTSRCEDDGDCDEPLVCDDYSETCVDLPAEGEPCDSACGAGLVCYDHFCVRSDATCLGCERDERCVEGACVVPKENGEPCVSSSECMIHCHPYKKVCADYEPVMCLWTAGWYLPGNG